MELFLLIVAIVQLAVADLIVNNSQPNYEYDVNRNGYVPFHNPNIVNLRPLYANIPLQYQDFANRTLAKQPHGVCQKEVPLVFFYINFHNFFSSFSLWLLPKFFLFFSVISLPSWKKYHSKFNILFRTSSLLETGATAPRGNGVNQFKIKLFLWTENHHNFIWFNFFFFVSFYQSNPTLSRITVCCQGYQRNAHIFRKCDPICENECINGICYSPNECICYPNHLKNLAGYCVPTCPIGALNSQILLEIMRKNCVYSVI